MPFNSRTETFSGHLRVKAPVERVFPLFSPMGEKNWVRGWDPEILHPTDRDWEEGMIFRSSEESGTAVWVLSRLDLSMHQVQYVRIEPDYYVARIEVICKETSADCTDVFTKYSFIGLASAGNEAIGRMTAKEYDSKMTKWAAWLESFLSSNMAGNS